MTDLKFDLLRRAYAASPANPLSEIDLLNSNPKIINQIQDALNDLFYQKYLSIPLGSQTVIITSAGRIAYEAAKEEREKQATEDRIRKLNKKLNITIALSPFVIFALDLFVEYLPSIIEWIISLFP